MTTIDDAQRAEPRARQRELADRLKASVCWMAFSSRSLPARCRWAGMTGMLKGL